MAKYRKIDPRIWNDSFFCRLSDRGQLAFLFILSHPHMTPVGAMRATMAGLAAERGWSEKDLREALSVALSEGRIKVDEKSCFLSVTNFLRYNPPESPNVVTSWAKSWDDIPECELKVDLYQSCKDYVEGLSEAYKEAFLKGCRQPSPNQEQEQEQEQEQDKEPFAPSDPAPEPPAPVVMTFPVKPYKKGDADEWHLTQQKLDEYRETYGVDVLPEVRKAKQWLIDNPIKQKTYKGMPTFIGTWLMNANNRGTMAGLPPSAKRNGPGHTPSQLSSAEELKGWQE